MTEGFPLLTTKKMPFKTITTELLWFLRGDTNIKFLVDNGCHIWDGDAYKSYSDHFIGYEDVPNKELFIEQIKTDYEFAKKWGELGPVYGKQWRDWEGLNSNTDQIQNLINDLKTNPDSRRLMVNAWNVGELDQMTLPPCHYGFQVYTRELSMEERRDLALKDTYLHTGWTEAEIDEFTKECDKLNVPTRAISLMWNQRSVDTFLGLPFNIASYGLLLEILAKEVNMVPDELIGNLGDTHLYSNHVEQAKEQVGREPFELPTLSQFPTYEGSRPSIESYVIGDFTLNDYQSHPSIKAPLSN
jgi:thymidylate synthase